eukprot:1419483-Rhodomonas_salina.3
MRGRGTHGMARDGSESRRDAELFLYQCWQLLRDIAALTMNVSIFTMNRSDRCRNGGFDCAGVVTTVDMEMLLAWMLSASPRQQLHDCNYVYQRLKHKSPVHLVVLGPRLRGSIDVEPESDACSRQCFVSSTSTS